MVKNVSELKTLSEVVGGGKKSPVAELKEMLQLVAIMRGEVVEPEDPMSKIVDVLRPLVAAAAQKLSAPAAPAPNPPRAELPPRTVRAELPPPAAPVEAPKPAPAAPVEEPENIKLAKQYSAGLLESYQKGLDPATLAEVIYEGTADADLDKLHAIASKPDIVRDLQTVEPAFNEKAAHAWLVSLFANVVKLLDEDDLPEAPEAPEAPATPAETPAAPTAPPLEGANHASSVVVGADGPK
jgi:hypothetical protein